MQRIIVLMLLKTLLSWFIYSNLEAVVYSFCGGTLSLAAYGILPDTERTAMMAEAFSEINSAQDA